MKKTAGALLGILMMLMFVSSANAAWTYEQTFNTLNNGDLNGQDSWSGSTAFDVVTTGTPYEGAKHLSFSTLADIDISRNITPTENGTLYFSVKKPTTNQDTFLFILKNNNGLSDINIYFNANGQIQAYNGTTASWQTIQNYSANSYYRIGIQFELSQNGWQGLAQRTYKVNIDGGAWSAAKGVERSNGITINSVRLSKQGNSYSGTAYLDFINPSYAFGPPPSLKLPFKEGEIWWVSQGNGQGNHINALQYAWDFNWGAGEQDRGKSVFAPATGTVVNLDNSCPDPEPIDTCNGGWGNYVIIDYGNNYFGKLAHLKTVNVQLNQQVVQGQVIGTVGSSGRKWSDPQQTILHGPHIHYQTQDFPGLNDVSIASSFSDVPTNGGVPIGCNCSFVDCMTIDCNNLNAYCYKSSNTIP
ncbi:MAG: Peptidase M23 [Candidatus Azambacteria bacterium GW2011_GWB2_46_37]|uniref:Peptidase M23 n=6 Tax=Candidatus Azamiibacteriota TaxID=1752741 RepID=A0A0G1Q4L8_9BACT|nr:MAG: Peptidase M23 [Candidatus Azambacteria bacterium GW2011_GWA2_45_90]KKU34704.1 MAG: Peptidase M23 [Candidatus Azambacteria bacterium GW2011_GWB1_46_27]KKU37228.1 MAG: Peptidase M23 [Candidatus Azambacteria bacterium GW2011_GWF2_46_32]KKU39197.1 MAG: Peptidase M23 [Candidatus Azambacteria bacterium GW2011_GWB2_46_37]KKU39782.1 MAG: Peptidase M23 [Candidatus Azambacteria bacterium GW2011_GWE2_46_45]KKU40753.1 MAG: Peptidase M23 [Candidatus Azambacteria bacterium GW2011_GWD2_46_48]HAM9589